MTGLYFGSFNPIHAGHLIVAQSFFNTGKFSKIIFIVSPQNPFKSSAELLPQEVRFEWVQKAIADNPNFEVSNIEFDMPKPSYTIDTLNELIKRGIENPAILIGGDNVQGLLKWKLINEIVEKARIFVYQRGEEKTTEMPFEINYIDAPFVHISGTYIRQIAAQGKSLKYLVSDHILQEVENTLTLQKNHG